MNELPWPKRSALKRLLAMGVSHRGIAQTVGCSKPTVGRYASLWKLSPTCACGRPAGHRAWCHVRLEFSPKRRVFLADRWGKRAGDHIATEVDRAYREAKTLGHNLGSFVWGSSGSTAVAYALCATCGKSARLNDGDLRRHVIDGTALRKQCFSKAELAAQRVAAKERAEWRKAKGIVSELHRHLRRPNSPTAASRPVPTSHG